MSTSADIFQQYTNYVDKFMTSSSQVFINYYKNRFVTGLEKYFLQIQSWLDSSPEKNMPLVIQAEGGVGKKTLLVKWMQHHMQQTRKQKDIILMHFATSGGNNSNYFYAIYKILIKLRQILNIGQKVQLHEEKLRKYFAYWLEVCDRKLQNQLIMNQDTDYGKIILVIEGIDFFVDRETGKQSNISFWLPIAFPKNLRIIVTADPGSEALNYFQSLGTKKIIIPPDVGVAKTIVKFKNNKAGFVSPQVFHRLSNILVSKMNNPDFMVTSLYIKTFLSCLLPYPTDEIINLRDITPGYFNDKVNILKDDFLDSLINIEKLLQFVLDFWQKNLIDEEKYRHLMIVFMITQKGITLEQIGCVTKASREQINLFLAVFKIFLMKYRDLWMIKNDSFKRAITRKYKLKHTPYHQKIAQVLNNAPNSVRKLEEQTFHLFMAKSYFKLKELVSNVQNFLLLFNPYNKYDLCKYWQVLEEKNFDPVFEYNKAIEGFEIHFHPTPQQLFRILVQISRFLKEFSDFQNYGTPRFKHTKIVGSSKILNELSIYSQMHQLDLVEEQLEEAETDHYIEEGCDEVQMKIKDYLKKLDKKFSKQMRTTLNIVPQTPALPKVESKIYKAALDANPLLMNVDIPNNRAKFMDYYMTEIHRFIKLNSKDKDNQDSLQLKFKGDQPVFRRETIDFSRLARQEYDLELRNPENYYYKRWIWLQFPWVCISLKVDYSKKLKQCFNSPTEYMSVRQQSQFTKQALKIALEAKLKKQKVLQSVEQVKLAKVSSACEFKSGILKDSQAHRRFTSKTFLDQNYLSMEIDRKNYSHNKVMDLNVSSIRSPHQSFQPHNQTFLTSEAQEQLAKKGFLPMIRKKVVKEMSKQIEEQTRKRDKLRKLFDQLVFDNNKLAKKLKYVKVLELNQEEATSNLSNETTIKVQLKELQNKHERIRHDFAYSQLQKERLQNLLLICKLNQTKNEQQVKNLNLQANNIKKMIKYVKSENNKMQAQMIQRSRLTRRKLNIVKKIIANQNIAKQEYDHLTQMKDQFDQKLILFNKSMEKEVQDERVKIQELNNQMIDDKRKNQSMIHQTEKQKKLLEDMERNDVTISELQKILDFRNPNFVNHPTFIELRNQYETNRRIKAELTDLSNRNRELQRMKREAINSLETINKAYNISDLNLKENVKEDECDLTKQRRVENHVEFREEPNIGLKRTFQEKQRYFRKLNSLNDNITEMIFFMASRFKFAKVQKESCVNICKKVEEQLNKLKKQKGPQFDTVIMREPRDSQVEHTLFQSHDQ